MEPLEVLRAEIPTLDLRDARTVGDGWDSFVVEVGGNVFRFPRRPEVETWLEREAALLPELAPTLPVAVPHFAHVGRAGVPYVGYRKIEGLPAVSGIDECTGEDLGLFLVALHAFPVDRARELGVPCFEPREWRGRLHRFVSALRARVVPLLEPGERERAEALFARVERLEFVPALVHADLGPEHVLCRGGRVVGVIDWSDARVGDPAIDLAWCLHGTPDAVASAVARVYGVDEALRERALFYHCLGPWHEVVHGLDTGEQRFVRSGLDGVRTRLPR
jgi:aminoglycoside phosphotransferase (APT) family kinase protein